jgi:hypothetical protein
MARRAGRNHTSNSVASNNTTYADQAFPQVFNRQFPNLFMDGLERPAQRR